MKLKHKYQKNINKLNCWPPIQWMKMTRLKKSMNSYLSEESGKSAPQIPAFEK